jgi:hypothetical protein
MQYFQFLQTIRREIFFGLLFIILFGSGCRRGVDKFNQPKNLQGSFAEVFSLYKQIGYNELDTISKTFTTIDQIVEYYDSVSTKPPDFQLLVDTRNLLSAYLDSFDEFYEEIYSVEDNLLSLESSYRAKKIGKAELEKYIDQENILLRNIQDRIKRMRFKADSAVTTFNALHLDMRHSSTESP